MDRSPLAFLAALLLHFVLFGLAGMVPRFGPSAKSPSPPVMIELETPRNSSLTQKKLLIEEKTNTNLSQEPAESAKYFSNRNRHVRRETRARNGGVADLSRFQSPSLREEILSKKSKPDQLQDGQLVRRLSPGSEAQRLDDLDLPEGAENLLNTAESIHYSFYSRIYGALAPVWQSFIRNTRPSRALSPGNYTVVAHLVLDAQGNLVRIEFQERSEVPQFNQAVIASVSKVKKFPNPPRDLIAGRREFRTLWSFTVNVSRNSFMSVAPPQRID